MPHLRTRFEGLLGTNKPLAAARIRGGLSYLLGSHEGCLTGLEVAAPQGTDAHAHQLLHAQPQAGEHLAHLALEPLLQHHAGTARTQAGDVLGLGLSLGNANSLKQLNEHTVVESLVKSYPVLLLDSAAGVADALAKGAVVGENNQSFAVGIQAAHIIGVAVLGRQQIVYCANGALCIAAAHIATRLVEQQHNLFLGGGMAAIHLHKIRGKHAQTGGIHGLAVHFYSPFCYQAVGSAAGFIAAGCQKLVQTHAAFGGGRVTAVLFCHV